MEDVAKIKKANSDHLEACFTIQKMAKFIFSNNVGVSEDDGKTKQEARKALITFEKHKKETEALIWDWEKANIKWLKKQNKGRKQEIRHLQENQVGADQDEV